MRRLLLPAVLAGLLLVLSAATAVAAPPLRECANVEGALCGGVRVPLDRLDPASTATINVRYELHPRTDASRPSLGTLVFMEGGPGYSSAASRDYYLALAGPAQSRRDVLLVDARGTGRSGALNCPALQSYEGDYLENARVCAESLGATATLYGSGNAAEDLVAVLDELGVARIDLYGDSYGTFNAQTFAVRHPDRVRSLVLDGAYPIAGLDPWYPDTVRALVRALQLTCSRSPASCPTSAGAVAGRLSAIVASLQAAPVTGSARDADGVRHPVVADPDTLISTLSAADSQPVVYRELFAAVDAAAAGDSKPLLRMVAETTYWGDAGAVREYSEAHYLAVACHDYPQVFDPSLPLGAPRQASFTAARDALPANAFAPFPRNVWAASTWMSYDLCITWPAPLHADPPLPPGTAYPSTPTLVLNGDLDQRTSSEGARRVAAAFPGAAFVEVANVGHVTAISDLQGCIEGVVRRFWRDLAAGDTSCARNDYAAVRLVGSFPRELADVDGAWRSGSAPVRLRRAARLAAATVADVTWRWQSMLGTEGVGLRGGTFALDGDDVVTMTLADLKLAGNLAVTGSGEWNRATGSVTARVDVTGAVAGRLRLSWPTDDPGAVATVSGRLDGEPVEGTFLAP